MVALLQYFYMRGASLLLGQKPLARNVFQSLQTRGKEVVHFAIFPLKQKLRERSL